MEIKQNLKAFGLLESIVAIGVFGVTIVAALSLIVKSLSIIKDNQFTDQAFSSIYSSLEYVRSPFFDPANLNKGRVYYVTIDPNTGLISGISEVLSGGELLPNEASCNESSDYFIDIDGPDSKGIFCNQITVDYVNPSDVNSDYIIKSLGVYKMRDGQYYSTQAVGFKNRNQI